MDNISQINVRTGDCSLDGIDSDAFEVAVLRAIRAAYPDVPATSITCDVMRNTDCRTEVTIASDMDEHDERNVQDEVYDLVQYTYKRMCGA